MDLVELEDELRYEIEESGHHLELAESEKDRLAIRGHITGLQRAISLINGEAKRIYLCRNCWQIEALPHRRFCARCEPSQMSF